MNRPFLTDTERILVAAGKMFIDIGYVDVALLCRMVGIPEMVIENVLKQYKYKASGIPGQFILSK